MKRCNVKVVFYKFTYIQSIVIINSLATEYYIFK